MTPKLTKLDAALLRWAVGVAIESEEELIGCYLDHKGRSIDPRTTRQAKATIKRLRRLWRKLLPATAAEDAAPRSKK